MTRPTWQDTFTPAAALERLGLRGDRLAFGLAGIGGAWGPVDEGVARETLRQAVEFGIGIFDVAPPYGTAEKLLGEALARRAAGGEHENRPGPGPRRAGDQI